MRKGRLGLMVLGLALPQAVSVFTVNFGEQAAAVAEH